MIILDLESSGGPAEKVGLWQIGAVDLDDMSEFLEESKIDDDDLITGDSLKIIGKTEEELRDKSKQSTKEMLRHFFKWFEKRKTKNFLSQSPQVLDFPILRMKAEKYGLKFPIEYRTFDLHSIAQTRYYQINKNFLYKEGESDLGLKNIMTFVGLKDDRIHLKDGKVVQEGKPHNALEDAKIQAECFSRLIYGKNLLPEFKKMPIPNYLLQ